MRPFHDRHDLNSGGTHTGSPREAEIDGGKMDGFVKRAGEQSSILKLGATPMMRWATTRGKDIPNYWTYARDFVLQDHMFGSVASWSLPFSPVSCLDVVGALHHGTTIHVSCTNAP